MAAGLLCVTKFHQNSDGYYVGAGEDFAYVVWGEIDRLSDAEAIAEYWAALHTKSAAEQNADSSRQLLDGAEVTGAECVPLELGAENGRARTWADLHGRQEVDRGAHEGVQRAVVLG